MALDSPAVVILSTALLFHRGGRYYFTIQDLIVEAWQSNRNLLGMKGYEQSYPDSLKVSQMLYPKDGILHKYFGQRADGKFYLLGPGINLAEQLRARKT